MARPQALLEACKSQAPVEALSEMDLRSWAFLGLSQSRQRPDQVERRAPRKYTERTSLGVLSTRPWNVVTVEAGKVKRHRFSNISGVHESRKTGRTEVFGSVLWSVLFILS